MICVASDNAYVGNYLNVYLHAIRHSGFPEFKILFILNEVI